MGSRRLGAALCCLCFSAASLFSLGKGEERAEPEIRDSLWTLGITAFDTSSLSPSNAALARSIMRDLAGNIGRISTRLRVAEEYAHHEGIARRADLAVAARALVNKRNERDQLLYRGEREWRYRRNLKTLDAEIERLENDYREAEEAEILIDREPEFTLSSQNLEGLFPAPPAAGEERRFCGDQRLDALIVGTMGEYHDRIYVTQKLYILYVDSYVYEESILFSSEYSREAMEEFAGGISLAISGKPPAELRISARPAEARIYLDSAYAGEGDFYNPLYPPGKLGLEFYAEGHESASAELELQGGELTEVLVDLRPLETTTLDITVPGKEGAAVYRGSLYVGQAPLSLELPAGSLEYVFVESPDGENAKTVFLSPAPNILPPAIRTGRRAGSDLAGSSLSIRTGPAYDAKEGRVDRTRRQNYWAWGGVWASAIAAWMINGWSNSVILAYNNSANQTLKLYNQAKDAQLWNYVGMGLVSVAVVADIVFMIRYIHTSGKDAPVFVD
jgi:hypothetical protein